jgi:cytochrome oxidase Cu insertion factor (SCO1/SenC/PrrC family)
MARPQTRPDGPSRFPLVAVVAAGILILVAGGLVGLAFRERPNGAGGTLLATAVGGPFQLIDQNGKPVSDADLKGKWQLVFFGYTHCPDTCPTALNEIALALDRLGPKRTEIEPVFITVDPERDTPEVLKAYVASFDAPIIALTGSPDAVAQAAKAYRVYYAKHPRADGGYDMDHSAAIYVMDPQGRFTATFTPDTTAETMAARLQKLLS